MDKFIPRAVKNLKRKSQSTSQQENKGRPTVRRTQSKQNQSSKGQSTALSTPDEKKSRIVAATVSNIVNVIENTDKKNNIDISNIRTNNEFTSRFVSLQTSINNQNDKPLIDVGPLSLKRQIPMYKRQRQPSGSLPTATKRNCAPEPGRNYSGLAWQPEHRNEDRGVVKERTKGSSSTGQNPYYPRDWEYMDAGFHYNLRPPDHRNFDFTVMSYNVLSQNLLMDNIDMYRCSRQAYLDWDYRRARLLEELTYHSPDIICLQEVHMSHYENFFKPELTELGYDCTYVKRTTDKFDGCATFYKRSKFLLDESIPIYYYHPAGGTVLDRDNVALIVKLIPVTRSRRYTSNRRICVSNTHLLFNPKAGEKKLAQLMVLFSEIDKHGFLGNSQHPDQYHALIMCGDYNTVPQSPLYKLLTMGYLYYVGLRCARLSGQQEGLMARRVATLDKDFFPSALGINDDCQYCEEVNSRTERGHQDSTDTDNVVSTGSQGMGKIQHQLKLVSVYDHTIARLNHRYDEMTTHHGRSACTVDYIFYGVRSALVRFRSGKVEMKNVEDGKLTLLGRYGLLADHELEEMGSLPNKRLGSDHLSILAKFCLN